jgi:tetratricopeptide (TPR) repeat protein
MLYLKRMVVPFAGLFIVMVLLISSCSNQNDTITNRKDYVQFLQPSTTELNKIDRDIVFWSQKLKEDSSHTGAQLKLAGLYSRRFQYSGNIDELVEARKLYEKANRLQKHFTSSTYRQLATLSITQHRFWQAKFYLDSAYRLGDNLAYTLLQQFDAEMELGNVYAAEKYLNRYPQQQSFEVLIRKAKLSDHNGNLDKAIELLEDALTKITLNNNPHEWSWAKSNLGDYYSHANRFTDAYKAYLAVLKEEPQNYHCLKGIAWLAFSKDRNTAAAKEILAFLKQQHPVPDYDWMLAEIAAFEENKTAQINYLASFEQKTTGTQYEAMYNKYLFAMYADEKKDYNKAMQIAQQEIKNRPVPASYDMLSWVYYRKGNYREALRIAEANVENKCFEPDVLYHLALIYKANNQSERYNALLKEVKTAVFELGPAFEKELKNI